MSAWANGQAHVIPVRPNTVAKSLAIGNPADGIYAIRVLNESGGTANAVPEPEVVEGIKLLAETEGIFTETAGGVTVAALKELAESGAIHPDELTVVYITGNGIEDAGSSGRRGEPVVRKAYDEVFRRRSARAHRRGGVMPGGENSASSSRFWMTW